MDIMFSGESLVFGFPNAEKVGLHQLGSAYPSSSSNTPSSFYSPPSIEMPPKKGGFRGSVGGEVVEMKRNI